jgi:hypothetical protein
MNQVKWLRLSLILLLALGLAIPALAQVRPLTLSDSQEPGSVIVFPKFIRGTVAVDGEVRPRSEIEVGVVCPKGAVCPERQTIKLRFHWVCPADQTFENKYICQEVDFDVFVTVNGKLVFDPNGVINALFGNTAVPPAPCDRGYLIGWVINTSDQPIKFDGLIGDAVLRESPTSVSAYNAIPIQADTALGNGALIALDDNGGLVFDGAPGHYTAVTGKIYGDVRYSNVAARPTTAPASIFTQTFLTLLTLDVRSNRPNLPTFVDLKFYNENERLVSTFTEFICWTEVGLTELNGGLSQTSIGSRKGVVVSGAAEKDRPFGLADDSEEAAALASDTPGRVTLLGIVDTVEYAPVAVDAIVVPDGIVRAYSYSLYNDSKPVYTTFYPAN